MSPTVARACSCLGVTACGAPWVHYGDTVFVGDVLGVEGFVVRVRVVEDLVGMHRRGETVEVTNSGPCPYGFMPGRRYLVDAGQYRGKLMTGLCSMTSEGGRAAVRLHELRRRAAGRPLPDLTGAITKLPEIQRRDPVESTREVGVLLEPFAGGRALRTKSDVDGVYVFERVPVGRYRVSLTELPKNWIVAGSPGGAAGATDGSTFSKTEDEQTGCRALTWLEPTGWLAGRVVAQTEMLARVKVRLYRIERDGSRGFRVGELLVNKDGAFQIGAVHGGSHELVVERAEDHVLAGDRRVVGDRVLARPMRVELQDGEQRTGVLLTVHGKP